MTIATPPVGSYQLDPATSRIAFVATHGLNSRVPGTFELLSGEVVVDDKPENSSIVARIDAGSVASGNWLRDTEVRSSMFLQVKTFPTFQFSASGPHRVDGDTWILDGTLVAHGASAPTPLTVTSLDLTDDGFLAEATARVDRFAHGVKGARGLLGQHLDIAITACARH